MCMYQRGLTPRHQRKVWLANRQQPQNFKHKTCSLVNLFLALLERIIQLSIGGSWMDGSDDLNIITLLAALSYLHLRTTLYHIAWVSEIRHTALSSKATFGRVCQESASLWGQYLGDSLCRNEVSQNHAVRQTRGSCCLYLQPRYSWTKHKYSNDVCTILPPWFAAMVFFDYLSNAWRLVHLGRCVASVQQPFAENIDKHLTHVLLRTESPSSKSYVLSNKHARLRRPNRGRLSRETSGSLATRLVAHRARLRVPSHSPCLTVSTHGPLYFFYI